TVHTIEVQNIISTDAINIQNVIFTNSATSLLILVSPVSDNTTNATGLTTSSKNVSAVWEHFTILSKESKAKCDHCRSLLAYKKGTGISHLWRHLKSCTKYKRNNSLDIIIQDKLCFQFVEKAGFHKFLSSVLPCFSMSADTVNSNNTAIREFIDSALQDSITIKKELFHNCCLAHILNLIVKDGLKKISELIVKYVTNSEDSSIVSSFESQLDDFFEYFKKAQTSQPDSLQEVKQYLDENIVNKTTNVLEWWRLNKSQFSNLSAIVQDILAILATSIASEQMFSCADCIIDDKCTSLNSSTITALMY
ncbi:26007_t:CDS:2, partial [Dentiscutata erythropus]